MAAAGAYGIGCLVVTGWKWYTGVRDDSAHAVLQSLAAVQSEQEDISSQLSSLATSIQQAQVRTSQTTGLTSNGMERRLHSA